MNMNNDLELFKVLEENKLEFLGTFKDKEDLEEFVGTDLQEHFVSNMTYIVLFKGGFVGCFSN